MKKFKKEICEEDKKIYAYFNEVIKNLEIDVDFASHTDASFYSQELQKAHEIRQLFIDTHLMEEIENEN